QVTVTHRDRLVAGLLIVVDVGQASGFGHGEIPHWRQIELCSSFVPLKSRPLPPRDRFRPLDFGDLPQDIPLCIWRWRPSRRISARSAWSRESPIALPGSAYAMMSGVIW